MLTPARRRGAALPASPDLLFPGGPTTSWSTQPPLLRKDDIEATQKPTGRGFALFGFFNPTATGETSVNATTEMSPKERQERINREIREAHGHEGQARDLLVRCERLQIQEPETHAALAEAGVQTADEETRGMSQKRLRSVAKEAYELLRIGKTRRAKWHLELADGLYWSVTQREVRRVCRFAGMACGRSHKRIGFGLDSEDLGQHDLLGVYEAALRFNPDAGVSFCTYARHWVRAERVRARQKALSAFVVSGQAADALIKVASCRRRREANGLSCTRHEIAVETGMGIRDLENLQSVLACVSLDDSISADSVDGTTARIADVVADDGMTELMDRQEDVVDVRAALDAGLFVLTERQRNVLFARFGFDGTGEPSTFRAIGAQYGMSHEWARLEEAHAVRKLCEMSDWPVPNQPDGPADDARAG